MRQETQKLNNRKLALIGVVTVLILLALAAYVIQESPVTLSKRYQDMESPSCHFSGYLQWATEEDYEATDMMVSDEELRPFFQQSSFKRASHAAEEPDVSFRIYLYGHKVYSIIVGQNGEISVEDTNNPDKTRTFWTDDGGLFESIYETHLANGGDPINS